MTTARLDAWPGAIRRIISAGQAGAERAGLDWAIGHGIAYGGFCRRRRKSKSGPGAENNGLIETPSRSSARCEERNVMESEGTLIFTCKQGMNSGARRIEAFSRKHGRPVLHVWRAAPLSWTVGAVRAFARDHGMGVVNVTGSRRSKEPAVIQFVQEVLTSAFHVPPESGVRIVEPNRKNELESRSP